MYSFEQLKIFVTVVETGSFSAAARKLKRAQSGVSQAIANLEIAINQELFNRDKNTPTLTDKGRVLLPVAQSILNQQTFFDQKIASLERAHEHEVVIAVDESLLNSSLLNLLSALAEKFPVTQVDIVTVPTFDVEALVRAGKADVGLVFADGELKVDMDFFTLGYSRFLTVAAPKHALTQLALVHEVDLKGHRQLVLRSRDRKELWFSYAISTKLWFANSHQTLAELASLGVGWGLLPERVVRPLIDKGHLVVLPVTHEFEGWLTTVGCLVSRTRGRGPVLAQLIETLQAYRYQDD